ncbi:MAG: hypothetical protein KGN34_16945, partial [Sphingomonadales bacterium]|nr:hypothetical protein [Sphingomonadales bacterium]
FARRGGVWRYPGRVTGLGSTVAPPIAGLGFRFSATLDLPRGDVTGPVFAQGGQMGGIGLYLDGGRPRFILNDLKGGSVAVVADAALPAGRSALALDVRRGAPGADGASDYAVTIRNGDAILAQQTVHFALPAYFGLSEVFGVGEDAGSPVLKGYPAGVPLPGRISGAVFDLAPRK